MLLDDALEGEQDVLFDLQRNQKDVCLDIVHYGLVVGHKRQELVAGRFTQSYHGLIVGQLGKFASEGVEEADEMLIGVSFVLLDVQIRNLEDPLENLVFGRRRVQVSQFLPRIECI